MSSFPTQHSESVLFITLDSCRYDTAATAQLPVLSQVSRLQRAWAPGNFTYASHLAMFAGFTPGDPYRREAVINPKYGKLFRMAQGGLKGQDRMVLEGENIKQGFKRKGYHVLGSGAVAWFNPATETAGALLRDFDAFFYPGCNWGLEQQLGWVGEQLALRQGERVFLFLNIGETHVPYYFPGAAWSPEENPCLPFGAAGSDALKSRIRQRRALEYVDQQLAGLLRAFAGGIRYICADHGDCWGEDGLWEHGISHPKVLEVPVWYGEGDSRF